jgi:microcystin-dependent protein
MDIPFLSEIALFAFGFAPKGWAICQGQLLPINQNQALFSLLGTTFGGDGRVSFGLPDLRGRAPMGVGNGVVLGEIGGLETVTLNPTHLPAHTHATDASAVTAAGRCRNGAGDQRTPVGNIPAIESAAVTATYSTAAPDANMHAGAIAVAGTVTLAQTGGGQPHENRQPYLTLVYCIALQGIFPSQN